MSRIAAGPEGRPPPNASDRNVAAAPGGALLEGETPLLFGKYRLFRRQRQLLREDRPIDLGARAFDLLLTLLEADGKLVTKEEVRQRVWPAAAVEDHNIDVHVSLLRKALGSDRDLIRTEPGRGYRLVAVVDPVPDAPPTNLPAAISQLVGRKHELAELQDLIAAHRLVTLTGAGGIGKTQLGLEAARLALPRFPDGAWVVELGPLIDPELIPGAVALALGIEPGSNRSVTDQLASVLQKKHLLLVLDNCEHLIRAVARTAEALLRGVPRLHILATSQHPLAAEGEHRYCVAPLEIPPAEHGGAAQAIAHSAVQLFVERARAADPKFSWDDGTAAAVSNICRHLDGIPLAIELAAACVATMSIDVLARRLNDRFRLLRKGRHTALPQHQTLRAALDWSCGLLGEAERAVLRRVAIFAGSFTLDSAGAVAADDAIDEAQAADHVMDLVGKSLATFEARGPASRYRLLETTRAYALEKLADSGESDSLARRHADHYRELMERAGALWQTAPAPELVARYAPELDNIRAALDWAFEPHGDHENGVALAAASAPLLILLSMLRECRDLVRRALSRLDEVSRDRVHHEMRLQAALGISSMWAEGSVSETRDASERALKLAEEIGDTEYQLRALFILWTYPLRRGEYRASLAIARRFKQVAKNGTDLPGQLTAVRAEGVSLFHVGDHAGARAAMERIVADTSPNMGRSFAVRFGIDQRVASLVYLTRILWLQGFPDQAAHLTKVALEEARTVKNANALCMVLCDGVCAGAALSGERRMFEEYVAALADCADEHGLGLWQVLAAAFKGVAAVRRGDTAVGLRLLRTTLDGSHGTRVELRHTIFVEALTDALTATGHITEGLAAVQRILDHSLGNDGHWCVPELLRLRGELKTREDRLAAPTAEEDLLEALELGARQGARSWQLRAATSLARLRRGQGRYSEAARAIVPVYDRFTEGFGTADLRTARVLIEELRWRIDSLQPSA